MEICDYTVEELCALLEHSEVPSLITEGRDDYALFRGIGRRLGLADLLPAGGKSNVLQVRERRDQFTCPKIAFLVDRDTWLFSNLPHGLLGPDLVVTEGYSIENDLLRDANVEALIDEEDVENYYRDLRVVIEWFASGVQAKLRGATIDFDRSIRTIVDPETGTLAAEAAIDVATWGPCQALENQVMADYRKYLRGKTWLKLLAKYLCCGTRQIQHQPRAILEYGLRSGGQYSTSLITLLNNALI